MSDDAKCRFMEAAYPTLDVADTCDDHRHDPRVFALARALAEAVHGGPATDEQVGWFIGDADAVVDDFDPAPEVWTATEPQVVDADDDDLEGIDLTLTINGRPYVVQASDFEPAHPVARATWESWSA